jgi:TP901 family phage tail tape measure protein
MSNLRTSVLLDLGGNLESKSRSYGNALDTMARRGSRSMGLLRRSTLAMGRGLDALTNRYAGMLAGAGAAWKSYQAVLNSAALDKRLTQIRQTAGATKDEAAALRRELYLMSQQTGQSLDSLLDGFNNLIQSGLAWDESLATIRSVNNAMAVTGANAQVLSSGLTVAAEAFDFDLSKLKVSTELLDKMTVAGRLGNAELEDLSSIFARVGVNAKRAGLGFDATLGFIEQLSLIERNPERLATLADSTLRLFTNQKYLEKAAKVTRVKFYDPATGDKRAAFDVLDDIAAKYRTLTSDVRRDRFIQAAFGDADLDTRKGLGALLAGDAIKSARTMSETIASASGTIARDLPDAIDNAVDQTARLKTAMADAADAFARPVNDAVAGAAKYLLDDKKISGKQLLLGGAGIGLAGLGLAKLGGGLILRKLAGKASGGLGGLLGGMGSGPIPVYVVNNRMSMMPESYGGGWKGGAAGTGGAIARRGGRLGTAMAGAGKWAGRAGGALALAGTAFELYDAWSDDRRSTDAKVNASGRAVGSGLGGWGGAVAGAQLGAALGSVVPGLGTAIGAILGGLGGGLAGAWAGGNLGGQAMDNLGFRDAPEGRLRIEVSDDRTRVTRMDSRGMELDVDSGPYMAGVGQ